MPANPLTYISIVSIFTIGKTTFVTFLSSAPYRVNNKNLKDKSSLRFLFLLLSELWGMEGSGCPATGSVRAQGAHAPVEQRVGRQLGQWGKCVRRHRGVHQ